MPKILRYISILLATLPFPLTGTAEETNQRVAHIILFVPDGSDLPKGYQKRF